LENAYNADALGYIFGISKTIEFRGFIGMKQKRLFEMSDFPLSYGL
jgi:hypothetical protein